MLLVVYEYQRIWTLVPECTWARPWFLATWSRFGAERDAGYASPVACGRAHDFALKLPRLADIHVRRTQYISSRSLLNLRTKEPCLTYKQLLDLEALAEPRYQ